jgi:hypothetical protein
MISAGPPPNMTIVPVAFSALRIALAHLCRGFPDPIPDQVVALGYGHYHLARKLTIVDGNNWRFFGSLPLTAAMNSAGQHCSRQAMQRRLAWDEKPYVYDEFVLYYGRAARFIWGEAPIDPIAAFPVAEIYVSLGSGNEADEAMGYVGTRKRACGLRPTVTFSDDAPEVCTPYTHEEIVVHTHEEIESSSDTEPYTHEEIVERTYAEIFRRTAYHDKSYTYEEFVELFGKMRGPEIWTDATIRLMQERLEADIKDIWKDARVAITDLHCEFLKDDGTRPPESTPVANTLPLAAGHAESRVEAVINRLHAEAPEVVCTDEEFYGHTTAGHHGRGEPPLPIRPLSSYEKTLQLLQEQEYEQCYQQAVQLLPEQDQHGMSCFRTALESWCERATDPAVAAQPRRFCERLTPVAFSA